MIRFIRCVFSAMILATMLLGALNGLAHASAAPAHGRAVRSATLQQVDPNPDDSDAAADAATMQAWIDGATAQDATAGPDEGSLNQPGGDTVTAHLAKVDLADFYATVTFTNPDDADVWDYGIGFRFDGDNIRYQVNLQSDGGVRFRSYGTDDSAIGIYSTDQYDAAPGAENRLDLVVSGDTGYLAINGIFVSTLSLSVEMSGGDIFVGSGFDADYNNEGTVIGYANFQVWSLDGVTAPKTGTPTIGKQGGDQRDDAAAEQIVRDWYEAVYGDDDSADLSEYLTDDFVMNGTGATKDRDRDAFIAETQTNVAALKTAFPDITYTIADIIVAGDTVTARVIFKGTQTGDLGNIPATGKAVEVMEISIFKLDLDAGAIYDAWTVTDELGLLSQLGVTMTASE